MEKMERLAQAYTEAPWRKQLAIIGSFLVVLVLMAIVAVLYLSVDAKTAAAGRGILILQNRMDQRAHIIADLQSQLAFLTSADEMERRALELGFRPVAMGEPLYVVVPGYPGRQHASLAPPGRQTPPSVRLTPGEYTESVFAWLERQVAMPSFPLAELRR